MGPSTTKMAMQGRMSTEVASIERSTRRWTRPERPRAVLSASLGTSTRPSAPMKAVGR